MDQTQLANLAANFSNLHPALQQQLIQATQGNPYSLMQQNQLQQSQSQQNQFNQEQFGQQIPQYAQGNIQQNYTQQPVQQIVQPVALPVQQNDPSQYQQQNVYTDLENDIARAAEEYQQQTIAPQQIATQQQQHSSQEMMLMQLLREFIASEDDGKILASQLMKFAKFAQSKVAKQQNQQ
jgi:hypothetical protein